MSGELHDNAEKQALAPPGEQRGASLSRNTQELFNPLTSARAADEPSSLDCDSTASVFGDEAELYRKRETAQPPTEHAGVTVYEHPAKQAVEPMPPLTETLQQGPYDSSVKLNEQITQVPEVSQGLENLDDVKALATGIGEGLLHVGQETLNHLATPGAVENALLQIGPALDNAVNYYASTPPEQVLQDAREALGYAGQALEDTLGHPLKPEQRGKYAGVAMPAFFSVGTNKALTEKELEVLGGVKKLEQLTEAELDALNIRKVAGAGGDWPVINERASPDVVKQTDKMSCVSACGEMLSEGGIDQATLIERLGKPAPTQFLARHLGPDWIGKVKGDEALDGLLRGGSWATELREPMGTRYARLEPGHTVVVDGVDEAGNIIIRDPAHGTRYEMTRDNFLKVWTGISVYRK